MTLSKEHLAWALCSMMDGAKEHEIHEITGLPQDACKAIWSVYRQALQVPAQRPPKESD
jgi:hypothetical protein